MIAASLFIFINTSNRYFNESIAIIKKKFKSYQTFSLTNQTVEHTSFHGGQLVYIFLMTPRIYKTKPIILQTIEESDNQIVSNTLVPVDPRISWASIG